MDKMKKVKKKEKWQKHLPSSTGIWTPDFWTKLSQQRFEFWGRLDQKSSRFLKNLDFICSRKIPGKLASRSWSWIKRPKMTILYWNVCFMRWQNVTSVSNSDTHQFWKLHNFFSDIKTKDKLFVPRIIVLKENRF